MNTHDRIYTEGFRVDIDSLTDVYLYSDMFCV